MTAVTIDPGFSALVSPARTHQRTPRPATGRSTGRASRSTYRRRRLWAAALVLGAVIVTGEAGAALGGAPLAPPERSPSLPTAPSGSPSGSSVVVVRPGDTLWSIVERSHPGADPRPLVDELSAARDGAPLVVGETIRLPA
ncbi:MAG: hypothetical protein EXQ79_00840 [Acidimicrobiia bacterium]|nr:hypothetical protein [Acidimicrobiia bacterium]